MRDITFGSPFGYSYVFLSYVDIVIDYLKPCEKKKKSILIWIDKIKPGIKPDYIFVLLSLILSNESTSILVSSKNKANSFFRCLEIYFVNSKSTTTGSVNEINKQV